MRRVGKELGERDERIDRDERWRKCHVRGSEVVGSKRERKKGKLGERLRRVRTKSDSGGCVVVGTGGRGRIRQLTITNYR